MASNSFENFYTLSPTRTPPNSSAATASQMNLSTLTDYDQLIARSRSTGFLSKIEQDILRASSPINFDPENIEEVVVNGHKGILVNKSEINEWKGHIPISDYRINEDTNPDVIVKRSTQPIVYKQDMAIRYLRPPTPPPPGDIYIREEQVQLPAAPPLIIRQQPAAPHHSPAAPAARHPAAARDPRGTTTATAQLPAQNHLCPRKEDPAATAQGDNRALAESAQQAAVNHHREMAAL